MYIYLLMYYYFVTMLFSGQISTHVKQVLTYLEKIKVKNKYHPHTICFAIFH